jgi:hypothetical protein
VHVDQDIDAALFARVDRPIEVTVPLVAEHTRLGFDHFIVEADAYEVEAERLDPVEVGVGDEMVVPQFHEALGVGCAESLCEDPPQRVAVADAVRVVRKDARLDEQPVAEVHPAQLDRLGGFRFDKASATRFESRQCVSE